MSSNEEDEKRKKQMDNKRTKERMSRMRQSKLLTSIKEKLESSKDKLLPRRFNLISNEKLLEKLLIIFAFLKSKKDYQENFLKALRSCFSNYIKACEKALLESDTQDQISAQDECQPRKESTKEEILTKYPDTNKNTDLKEESLEKSEDDFTSPSKESSAPRVVEESLIQKSKPDLNKKNTD